MTGTILQARLDSQRLPAKILKRIGQHTIIEHCINAMTQIASDIRIIVTNPQSCGVVARYAKIHNTEVIIGHSTDVLSRFIRAIQLYRLKKIIRLTADNPFVSAEYANKALNAFAAIDCDYFHYTDLPRGTGVEVVSAASLCAANRYAHKSYDREHVTSYIYRNHHRFSVIRARGLENDYSKISVTVDTDEDYQKAKRIFAICNTPRPSLRNIITTCQTHCEK